jgi:hypothetical protein
VVVGREELGDGMSIGDVIGGWGERCLLKMWKYEESCEM